MSAIGFAIVGCGVAARSHALAIAATPGAALVRVHARDAAAREAFAREFAARPAATLDEALADPAVRVVVIATPSGTHGAIGAAAAAAGRHVLCEKPLEVSLAGADALIAACRRAGVILYPGFQNRFSPRVARLTSAIASGRIGRPLLGRASVRWHRDRRYFDAARWRGTLALDGGGALINQAIHTVDLLLHCLGEPLEVASLTANLARPGIEAEDAAVACLRFASGALATIEVTTAADRDHPPEVLITGTGGSVGMRGESLTPWAPATRGADDDGLPEAEMSDGAAFESTKHGKYCAQLADVLACVRDGRAPAVDAETARRALAVVLAVYAAARDGRTTRLDERRGAAR